MNKPSAADLGIVLDVVTPELGEPMYGGEHYLDNGDRARIATMTRFMVTNNVEVTFHNEPHRLDFIEVDNETGDIRATFVRQTKGRNRRDWKLAGRYIWTTMESLRHPMQPTHHVIADAIDRAWAKLAEPQDAPEGDGIVAAMAPAPVHPEHTGVCAIAYPHGAHTTNASRPDCPGVPAPVDEALKTAKIDWSGQRMTGTAESLRAGDRLVEVDGMPMNPIDDFETNLGLREGLLIEAACDFNDTGEVQRRVTAWGETRMFDLELDLDTPVMYLHR